MLGFDYFKLLDLLTIARSRKHIQKYYGLDEVGAFPERLKPINLRPDIDRRDEFQPVREVNNEIRRLTLAVYAPLQYVLPRRRRRRTTRSTARRSVVERVSSVKRIARRA